MKALRQGPGDLTSHASASAGSFALGQKAHIVGLRSKASTAYLDRRRTPNALCSHGTRHALRRASIRILTVFHVLGHVQDPNLRAVGTQDGILAPAPHVAAPLVQRYAAQRGAHFQPREARRLACFARRRLLLAVPHHHGAQPATSIRRRREDGADARALDGRVALLGHAQQRRR